MVTLLLSGGLDSVTLLALLRSEGRAVRCLSFDYGQRHRRELDAARRSAAAYGCPHDMLPLAGLGGGSALTGGAELPAAHHADPAQAATVVPGRNLLMLAAGAAHALRHCPDGAEPSVAHAAHAGDAAVYPDCREGFMLAARAALALCDARPVRLLTPFLNMGKAQVAAEARRLGVDIASTWSCYAGGESPCGVCGACSARREALGVDE